MRTRAAASSIASGNPSSRLQISRSSVSFSGVRSKDGWRSRALDEELHRLLLAERQHREDVLAGDVQHSPARDEKRHARRSREQGRVRWRCVAEVLGVVEHDEQLAILERLGDRLERRAVDALEVERLRDRREDEPRVTQRGELDEQRAVRELPGGLTRHGEREPRLAAPPRTCEDEQPRLPALEQAPKLTKLGISPDERVGRHGQRLRRRCVAAGELELRILVEDACLKPAECRTRLEPELVAKMYAGRRVVLERLGLPPRAIQGEHRQLVRSLAQRLLGREYERLAKHLGVCPERNPRRDSFLECDEAKLLQPLRLDPPEVVVREHAVGAAVPEAERLLGEGGGERRVVPLRGRALRHETLEATRIEIVGADGERVRAPVRLDRERLGERLAERGDVDLEELAGRGGRGLAPECVDELVDPGRPAPRDDERREQPPVLRGHCNGAVFADDLYRPKHAHLCRRHLGAF